MKHGLIAAISLVSIGCAGTEPTTITPAQPAAPAEVSVAPPKPETPPEPETPEAAPAPVESAKVANEHYGVLGVVKSDGAPPSSAQGNMWGDEVGASFGLGGLGGGGLSGGGGQGGTIGLGTIGGLGHSAGVGTGYGAGTGAGGFGKAKGPQIRMGATSATGALPPDVIRRIVRQSYGRFRLCYENGLRNNPTLAGDVTVKLVIEGDGSVSSVTDSGSTMPDKALVSCVMKAYGGLSFPKPEKGKVIVISPIAFSPAPPPAPPASGKTKADAPDATPKK